MAWVTHMEYYLEAAEVAPGKELRTALATFEPEMMQWFFHSLDPSTRPRTWADLKQRVLKHFDPTGFLHLPSYSKQCYLSDEHLLELKKLLTELLEKQFIVPSKAPIAAPVFFVGKDGSLRMVVDYRPLNRLTIREGYPMPRIQDLINRLGKAKWFSKFDLWSGYYQVQVATDDQWKTAFRTLWDLPVHPD
ncbi:rna-directed dna polymerase [Cystoisospora suis]|uniref:Rna-directed dna polymerase n=1 Tax=Cystoisospora suis TaxID=483139 RepID=A0A2C6KQ42_9APIC|nr:rna-directed dna polymerase [Cystoisospora suis]